MDGTILNHWEYWIVRDDTDILERIAPQEKSRRAHPSAQRRAGGRQRPSRQLGRAGVAQPQQVRIPRPDPPRSTRAATEIWDRPCYPDFASLPEAPDHLVVLVPAAGVAETLRAGAAAGARSATVFSAGFGESFNADGAALGRELAAAIAETGLAVSGPNCMGNVCSKTRLVTLTEDRLLKLQEGPVAMVGQSGGMMIFANAGLKERGIIAEYLITSGNETGLSVGDYIAFFADQPELKVIVIYVEAMADLETFKAACRMARGAGKHIVALKLGQSEGGRQAALAHTGSLAGSIRGVRRRGGRGRRGTRRHRSTMSSRSPSSLPIPARPADAISAPSRCRARSAACCSTPPRRTACISGRWTPRPRTN